MKTMPESGYRCTVCNDEYDGGLHYGAHVCVCCKAFFRRTIRQGMEYYCSYDGNCVIEGELRVTCRACRLDKCLTVGMQRDAVRPVRGPIKRIKKRGRKWSAWKPAEQEFESNSAGSPTASESSSCPSDEMHYSDHMEFLMEPSHCPFSAAILQDVAAGSTTTAEFCGSPPVNSFDYREMELLLNDICGSVSVHEAAVSPALSRNSSVSLAVEDLQFSDEFERQMMEWLTYNSSD